MLLRSIVVGTAVATLMSASPLRAETSILARAGGWEAFGGTTSKGRSVCGMSQATADGRYFGVKWFDGLDTLVLQLKWRNWDILDGAQQVLTMVFDGYKPWYVTAMGVHFADGDAGLEFTINKEEVEEFASEFRNAGTLRLQFARGKAKEWVVSLAGTNAVSESFRRCTRKLKV